MISIRGNHKCPRVPLPMTCPRKNALHAPPCLRIFKQVCIKAHQGSSFPCSRFPKRLCPFSVVALHSRPWQMSSCCKFLFPTHVSNITFNGVNRFGPMLMGVFINMVLYGVYHYVIRNLEPPGLTAFVTGIDCPGSHSESACSIFWATRLTKELSHIITI